MGRRSKSREVSKERLGPDFSEDEANFYRKYFRKLGGKKRDFLERSQVEQFLQRSELSQEILDEILKISIEFGETVDFEAFCVACRLVAHAQELGLVQVEQVALVPSNVPWFSEPAEKEVEASFQTVQEVQVEEPEFDFEGVALGVNAEAFSGPSTFLQSICLNVQKFFNLIATKQVLVQFNAVSGLPDSVMHLIQFCCGLVCSFCLCGVAGVAEAVRFNGPTVFLAVSQQVGQQKLQIPSQIRDKASS